MFKLQNQQAAALTSPAVQKLLNDESRTFPTTAAFQIADILNQIGARITEYQKANSAVAEQYEGEIQPNGSIKFPDPEKAEKAMKEIKKLAETELEYTGEKLKIGEDWPKLTVTEAMLLAPIIDNGASNGEEGT